VAFTDSNFARDEYIAVIPEPERHDMMLAYHAQLNSADEGTRLKAAKAWAKWECVFLSSLSLVSYDV
jgi:hypothetical protein